MALIPPSFLDCVVAIGTIQNGKKSWIGTGFLVGRFYRKVDEKKNEYHTFLVTNKHVLRSLQSIIIRFNPESSSESAKDYPIRLVDADGNKTWTSHPVEDVGIIHINAEILRSDARKFTYFQSDISLLSIKQMAEKGVSEGDCIYVLGYPMGIVAKDLQYVIVRSGSIARIRDLLEGRSNHFIGDAFVFPGNSGGPVVLKPELIHVQNTKPIKTAYLIGIVQGHIPYKDTAISVQTKRPRVIFEENSGLCAIIPTDFIMEAIEICAKSIGIV